LRVTPSRRPSCDSLERHTADAKFASSFAIFEPAGWYAISVAPADSEHGNAFAPASARQSKSVLNGHLAGYEWPVAIVDRGKMLVMKREMAYARRHRIVRRGPFLAARDHIQSPLFQRGVEHHRSGVAGSDQRARRCGILTFSKHGA
jgi:hypothetical protein